MRQRLVFVVLLAVSVLVPQAYGGNPPPPSNTCTDPNQIVYIPGFNLDMAVREFHKISGAITCSDMGSFTLLDASQYNIVSLEGLQHAQNLIALSLSYNQISNLTPLAGLTNLTTNLFLDGNQISDLTPLAELTDLTSLSLGENQISDLTPLAGLTNLTYLWLEGNQISDLTPLAGLTNLTRLELRNNRISDLTPLAGLRYLTYVELNNNQISNISPLVNNPGINDNDSVFVAYNCLDLSSGSDDLANINILIDRGVDVIYTPQDDCSP